MRAAVLADDPELLLKRCAEQQKMNSLDLEKRRVELLAAECAKYFDRDGVKDPNVIPSYSKAQINELVRETAFRFTVFLR